MTGRDGQPILRGGFDVTSGPVGYLVGLALFVAVTVTVVAVMVGLDRLASAVLPAWLALPVVLAAAAVLSVGGLYGVLRFNEWRRRR